MFTPRIAPRSTVFPYTTLFRSVADNGTDKSTLYNAEGTKQGLVVDIVNGAPTGIVFNGGSGFMVSATDVSETRSGPARFIFASESGTISGWSPTVDLTNSVVGVTTAGAVYKGLALAGGQLYATDFVGGKVDVFDSSFDAGTATGGFMDPKLSSGYAPFGIAALGSKLVVS